MNQASHEHLPGYATRWRGLIFIGISLVVISLDNTILNVAIPSISRSLGASASELQWIVDAYILVFASLLLTSGTIGDRFGRKKILQLGLIWFGGGSLLAALAPSTGALIIARALLGVGGAMIMPSTLSIISATFPPSERPRAIAIWAAIFALGVGIGPVVGGLLLVQFEWNAVFLVNLPVVAIAVIGGARYLADSKDDSAPRIDFPGVLLSIAGLFALIYGIIEAGILGWTHPNVLLAFGLAAVLLTLFGIWEARYPHAMLPLRFFKNMSFTGANVAISLIIFSLFGSVFFLNQYLQSILGYTALESGLFSLPLAVILSFTAANSAGVTKRLGTKITVSLGIAIAATGLLLMSRLFHIDTILPTIIFSQCVLALGMGLAMSPATNSIMGSVPVNKAGVGSAMNDTTRQLGGALGVAVLGTIMNNFYLNGVQVLQGDLPEPIFSAVSSSIQAANIVAANPDLPPALASAIVTTAGESFIVGMNQAMLIGAFIMYGAALFTLLVLPAQVRPPSIDILHTGEIAKVGDLPLPPRTPVNGRNGSKPPVATDKESLEI